MRRPPDALVGDDQRHEEHGGGQEPPGSQPVQPEALKYLNRLSDYLFVLGRRVNDGGARDVLWRPGANR